MNFIFFHSYKQIIALQYHQNVESKKINKKSLYTDRDIIITAYCPLGCPILWRKTTNIPYMDVKLKEIADKYNKTQAQVIRYILWVCVSFIDLKEKNGFYSIKNFNNRVKFIFSLYDKPWDDQIFFIYHFYHFCLKCFGLQYARDQLRNIYDLRIWLSIDWKWNFIYQFRSMLPLQ